MKLDSIKLKPRLIGAFLIVAAIAALIGMRGLSGMAQVGNAQDEMAAVFLPSVHGLGTVEAEMGRIRMAERTMLIPGLDSETRTNQAKRLADSWTSLEERWKIYEALPQSKDEAAAWNEFKPAFAKWKATHETAMALIDQGQITKAQGVSFGEGRTAANEATDSLSKTIDINMNNASETDKAADKDRTSARTMIIAFIIVGVLMAMGLGLFIANSVAKPVGQLSAAADRMALGDVDVSVNANGKDEIADLMRAMSAMVENTKSQAAAAEKIAAGDLSVEITQASDKDVLSKAMIAVVTSLRGLVAEAGMLSKAAVDGRLDTRGDATKFQGGYHDIVQGVNDCLDAVIGPLNATAEYIERISKGDIPDLITDNYKGDFNEIKNNLNLLITVANNLLKEADVLVKASEEGKLDTRGNADQFAGGWMELYKGINNILDAILLPIGEGNRILAQVSAGKIDELIAETYKGDHEAMKQNVNNVATVLQNLQIEMRRLTDASRDGMLSERGKPEHFQGAFGEVVQGVNTMLDAILLPIGEGNRILAQVSAGKIDELIAETYKGDHEAMKQNINNVATVLQNLQIEMRRLTDASRDGMLSERGKPEHFQGAFGEVVQGVNTMLDAILLPIGEGNRILAQVSAGKIDELIAETYKGDHEAMKQNINNIAVVLQQFKGEIDGLITATTDGRLDARADVSRYKGAYGDVLQGVNDLVDAFVGPLNVTAEYVERISKGDIPSLITDNYNGDFNEIKNNLNACINAVDAMAADTNALIQDSLAGKLSNRADVSKHQGDYAKIVGGVNEMLDAIILPVNEAAEVLVKLANNDLTARVVGSYQGDHAKIKDSLNSACEALEAIIIQAGQASAAVANTAKDVAGTASELGKASQSVAETINQVATGSQEQTKMVTSASSSMEQLSQAIEEVAKGAQSQAKTVEDTVQLVQQITSAIDSVARTTQSAASASQEVAEVAKTGGDSVEKSVEGMARIKETSANVATAVVQLGENSKQIGAIVETIDDIAEQTNLLALNAAIEAARAGEHGKGFAVVADEVRKLAERSSLATKEIADLIGKIQQMTEHAVEAMQAGTSEVEEGTELANQAGEALGSIVKAVNSIVQQIEDVSAATEEMSASSAEVAKAVESLSAVTEESTAATEEMAATASEVTRSVEQVAAVSEENAASAEEVSAAAQEQNASVEEMSASALEVAKIADDLQAVVSVFKVNGGGSAGRVRVEDGLKRAA